MEEPDCDFPPSEKELQPPIITKVSSSSSSSSSWVVSDAAAVPAAGHQGEKGRRVRRGVRRSEETTTTTEDEEDAGDLTSSFASSSLCHHSYNKGGDHSVATTVATTSTTGGGGTSVGGTEEEETPSATTTRTTTSTTIENGCHRTSPRSSRDEEEKTKTKKKKKKRKDDKKGQEDDDDGKDNKPPSKKEAGGENNNSTSASPPSTSQDPATAVVVTAICKGGSSHNVPSDETKPGRQDRELSSGGGVAVGVGNASSSERTLLTSNCGGGSGRSSSSAAGSASERTPSSSSSARRLRQSGQQTTSLSPSSSSSSSSPHTSPSSTSTSAAMQEANVSEKKKKKTKKKKKGGESDDGANTPTSPSRRHDGLGERKGSVRRDTFVVTPRGSRKKLSATTGVPPLNTDPADASPAAVVTKMDEGSACVASPTRRNDDEAMEKKLSLLGINDAGGAPAVVETNDGSAGHQASPSLSHTVSTSNNDVASEEDGREQQLTTTMGSINGPAFTETTEAKVVVVESQVQRPPEGGGTPDHPQKDGNPHGGKIDHPSGGREGYTTMMHDDVHQSPITVTVEESPPVMLDASYAVHHATTQVVQGTAVAGTGMTAAASSAPATTAVVSTSWQMKGDPAEEAVAPTIMSATSVAQVESSPPPPPPPPLSPTNHPFPGEYGKSTTSPVVTVVMEAAPAPTPTASSSSGVWQQGRQDGQLDAGVNGGYSNGTTATTTAMRPGGGDYSPATMTTSTPPTATTWCCTKCDFINKRKQGTCRACRNPRPVAVVPVQQPVNPIVVDDDGGGGWTVVPQQQQPQEHHGQQHYDTGYYHSAGSIGQQQQHLNHQYASMPQVYVPTVHAMGHQHQQSSILQVHVPSSPTVVIPTVTAAWPSQHSSPLSPRLVKVNGSPCHDGNNFQRHQATATTTTTSTTWSCPSCHHPNFMERDVCSFCKCHCPPSGPRGTSRPTHDHVVMTPLGSPPQCPTVVVDVRPTTVAYAHHSPSGASRRPMAQSLPPFPSPPHESHPHDSWQQHGQQQHYPAQHHFQRTPPRRYQSMPVSVGRPVPVMVHSPITPAPSAWSHQQGSVEEDDGMSSNANTKVVRHDHFQHPHPPYYQEHWEGFVQVSKYQPPRAQLVSTSINPNPILPNGRRKALLIGINYRKKAKLRGCINDVQNIKRLLLREGYPDDPSHMVCLTDDRSAESGRVKDDAYWPSMANIMKGLQWLTSDVRPGDVLFFHFSGHGEQRRDWKGVEVDGYNETILPSDYRKEGRISDDTLWGILVHPLPSGVRLTAIMDCCHSGTGLDLPFEFDLVEKRWKEDVNPALAAGDVVLLSGCEDGQLSEDCYNKLSNESHGAMTLAFTETYSKYAGRGGCTYPVLLKGIRDELSRLKKQQRPQLTATQQFDFKDRVFSLGVEGSFNQGNLNPRVGRLQRCHFRPGRKRQLDRSRSLFDSGVGWTAVAVAKMKHHAHGNRDWDDDSSDDEY